MTRSRLATVLIASIIGVGITSAKIVPFTDQARDPGLKKGIWFEVLGPSNSPYLPLYLTAEPFKTWTDENLLIVLPLAKYDIVSAFTRARLAHSDCPGDRALIDDWYTVEIAQHDKGRTQQCILPQRLACDYLSGFANLHGINWTTNELRIITRFMSQVRCKILIRDH